MRESTLLSVHFRRLSTRTNAVQLNPMFYPFNDEVQLFIHSLTTGV